MKLIDADKLLKFFIVDTANQTYRFGTVKKQIENAPTVKAIPLDQIKDAREQIIDEKDFAYADFDRYKEEVLNVESDELPDDDFRYGMERCLEILDKLIAESEG